MEPQVPFAVILQDYTPPRIEEYVLKHMRRSKVVMGTGNKPTLKLEEGENKLISNPCVYRWLVPEKNAKEMFGQQHQYILDNVAKISLEDNNVYYVLYFGKSSDGRNRIISQHLRGDTYKSTLRLTLCGLLLEQGKIAKEWEIDKYFAGTYFEWLHFNKDEEEDFIECVEAICIAMGTYPLNIDGNPAYTKEWKKSLMTLRGKCKKELSK